MYIEEVKDELIKVLQVIQTDRTLLCKLPKSAGSDDRHITAENLEDLAGNHLFDDYYWWFGISKHEGHKIRAYFQSGYHYEFVKELHREFPTIFDKEREEYLERVNVYRAMHDKQPISLK